MTRLIRVSSRALGERAWVRVYVYDTLEEMQAAAVAFTGEEDLDRAAAVTQAYYDEDKTVCLPIVRLARPQLTTTIVSHEMHHAATALYGVTLGPGARARAHLTHANEPFSHLFSDLYGRLNDALWKHGYFDA